MSRVVALNPISLPVPKLATGAVRLPDLGGKAIGFLTNNKPNGDALLGAAARALEGRLSISAEHYNKGVPSLEAPRELVEKIRKACQAVVLAVYD